MEFGTATRRACPVGRSSPVRWSQGYFNNLFKHEWVLTKSPAGAQQWTPKDAPKTVPDAHDPTKRHRPMMFTTDLALIKDPAYGGRYVSLTPGHECNISDDECVPSPLSLLPSPPA